MNKLLGASRYIVILAVLSALLSSITLLGLSLYRTVWEVYKLMTGESMKYVAATFIELADLYLLGVVILLIAIGLYKLFIDDSIRTPEWLEIHHIDHLKTKLVNLVVLVLAVSFLKQVVAWNNETNILFFGGGIGVVVAALTYFLGMKSK